MTYEDKLIDIFNRFRGEDVGPETLKAMQAACREEVWDHLPPKVRGSWHLNLGISEDNPGQIELRPQQVSTAVAPAELEAVLKRPFESFSDERIEGGMSGFSVGMAGDLDKPAAAATRPVIDDSPPEVERSEVKVEAASPAPEQAQQPEATSSGDSGAADIAKLAAELGISLPPNSSLLQPFLEALAVAAEYKQRVEMLEAKIEEIVGG